MPISLAETADRVEQGELYNLCFGKQDGVPALKWRYDGCPHGQTLAPIARDPGGRLVASYACSPREARFRGEALAPAIGQVGDVMTAPGLRSRGVFTDLHWNAMSRARARGWAATWGLPNKSSGRIFFGKLGWVLAGYIGPWNFLLRSDAAARRERLVNGRLASWGVPWAAWRGRRVRTRLGVSECSVAPLEHFPESVGDLSSHVEAGFDWMVHRSAAYLNWRFLEAPSGLFRAFGVWDRAGHLVGYSVTQRPRVDSHVGFVVDLLGADRAAEGAALEAALGDLDAQGAAVARAYGMRNSAWEQLLERGGFRRPRGYKPVGAYALDERNPVGAATLDTSRWFFTDGDRDDETAR